MWKYLTDEKYDELLLSLNLVNTSDIKKINKILYGISNNIDSNYEEIIIRKKSGGIRFLYEPSKILKSIQKNILKNILEEKKLFKYACAYRKHYKITDNAICHVDKPVILKLDIKDFFNNITFEKVYNACFNETLFPEKLGILLTNLCVLNNMLPQGAPTSGYISNVVLRSFDEKIDNYCKNKNISYTRYSDDLTFSGDFNVKEMINYVNKLLFANGFKLNKKKIKVVRNKTRQQVTGIVVNKKINIRKSYMKRIRQEVYYIKKYGLISHLNKINYKKGAKTYLLNLIGRINYVYDVTGRKEFLEYKRDIINVKRNL